MKINTEYENMFAAEFASRIKAHELPEPYLEILSEDESVSRNIGNIEMLDVSEGNVLPVASENIQLESVIRAFNRPSLIIQNGKFDSATSETWKNILSQYENNLINVLPAVGRIELKNHPKLDWAGTGFLIDSDIVVTNRHVANEFSRADGQGYSWKVNRYNKYIRGRIDFREEYNNPIEEEFSFTDILYVEPVAGPDIAFLRVETGGLSAEPLVLGGAAEVNDAVVTVGYPWKDSRTSTSVENIMQRIFGGIYNVKRLAPGKVTAVSEDDISHDCTTLGGNSGSAIIDVESGHVIALHYGSNLDYNIGVPVHVIKDRLGRLV